MNIIAIDPGTTQSALIEWDGKQIQKAYIWDNFDVLNFVGSHIIASVLVIEQFRSYGMTVGATTIDTIFWSGRFAEAWDGEFVLVPRMDVKMHLCHTSRAKPKNTRQAMIDRFGLPPTKKRSNDVYGGFKIATHLWSAWELAVTWWDKNQKS